MSASKYIRLNKVWKYEGVRYSSVNLRKIPGYEKYLADRNGRVYVRNRYGRIQQLTQFLSPNSKYLRVYITKNGIKKNYPVQNLIVSAFREYEPDKITVMHKDRNFLNNHLTNLRLRGFNIDKPDSEKLREYQIGLLEEKLREKTIRYGKENIWKVYYRIKGMRTKKTVLNWLNIVTKNL